MELLNALLWKESEVFSKVEELIGVTPIKDNENNYAYWDNNHWLCLCAHIDKVAGYNTSKHKWEWNKETKKMEHTMLVEVHPEPEIELIRMINIVMNKNGILGADDRAGIMAILYIMNICKEKGMRPPNILLTNHEESGGAGMKKFVTDCTPELMKDVHLIVALDRRGSVDYVYYNEPDKEVKMYTEMFGFLKSCGSYNDIKDLTDAWSIPSVNLSVGYYSAHTKSEELHLDEMLLTANRVIDMMENPIGKRYNVEKKESYTYSYSSSYDECGYGLGDSCRKNNVTKIYGVDAFIPRSLLDNLLSYKDLQLNWRIVCEDWEYYTEEQWREVLYDSKSLLYEIESFHIYSKHPVKFIKSDNTAHEGQCYLAVKFKDGKEYNELIKKRDDLDYGTARNDPDIIEAEGFRSKEQEQQALLEYREENESLYCMIFYEGLCDGGCGGLRQFCDDEMQKNKNAASID